MSTQCPGEQMQGACPSGREAFSPPPPVCPPRFLHRPLRSAFLPLPPDAECHWRSRLNDSPPTAAPQSQWALVRPTWNCHFLDSPVEQGNPSWGRSPGEGAQRWSSRRNTWKQLGKPAGVHGSRTRSGKHRSQNCPLRDPLFISQCPPCTRHRPDQSLLHSSSPTSTSPAT